MQDTVTLRVGELLEHEKLAGTFLVTNCNPVVLVRTVIHSRDGVFTKGPRGVLISDVKRGDTVVSQQFDGEFLLSHISADPDRLVLVQVLCPDTLDKWWLKSPSPH